MVEEWWMPYLAWGLLALATSAVCGLPWLLRPRADGGLLSRQPWRPKSSGGGEVLLFFLFLALVPPLVQTLLQAAGFFRLVYGAEPNLARQQLWVMVPALPLILGGTWPILNLRHRTRLEDIGVSGRRWPQNLLLGYLAWLVLTPLVLAIHLALNSLWEGEEHPLDRLSKEALLPVEWCLLVFQATVFAPLVEELAFRGLLQSWLYRASRRGHWLVALAAVLLPALPVLAWLCEQAVQVWLPELAARLPQNAAPSKSHLHGPWVFALVLAVIYLCCLHLDELWKMWRFTIRRWRPVLPVHPLLPPVPAGPNPPYAPGENQPLRAAEDRDEPVGTPAVACAPKALPAIVGTAFFFAVIHSSWPTPIPLFFLGLGLGWLTYRTQNLIGPVVVHVLFNGVACLVLALAKLLAE